MRKVPSNNSFLRLLIGITSIVLVITLFTRYTHDYSNKFTTVIKHVESEYEHYLELAKEIESGNLGKVKNEIAEWDDLNVFINDSVVSGQNRYLSYIPDTTFKPFLKYENNGLFLVGQQSYGDSILQFVFPLFLKAQVQNSYFVNSFPGNPEINPNYSVSEGTSASMSGAFELGNDQFYISRNDGLNAQKIPMNLNSYMVLLLIFLVFTLAYSYCYKEYRKISWRNLSSMALIYSGIYIFFNFFDFLFAQKDVEIFQPDSFISYFGFDSAVRFYYFLNYICFLIGSSLSLYFSRRPRMVSLKSPWNYLLVLVLTYAISIFFYINIADLVYNSSLNYFLPDIYPFTPVKHFYLSLIILSIYPLFAIFHICGRFLLKTLKETWILSIILAIALFFSFERLPDEYSTRTSFALILSLLLGAVLLLHKVKIFFIHKRIMNYGNIFWVIYMISITMFIFTSRANLKSKQKIENYLNSNFISVDAVIQTAVDAFIDDLEIMMDWGQLDGNEVQKMLSIEFAEFSESNESIKLDYYFEGDKIIPLDLSENDKENWEILELTESPSMLSIYQEPIYYAQISLEAKNEKVHAFLKFENDNSYNDNQVMNNLLRESIDKQMKYAVYEENKLISSSSKEFPEFMKDPGIKEDSVVYSNYANKILAMQKSGPRIILAESNYYNLETILSSFIFLFILFLLFYVFQQTVTLSSTQYFRFRNLNIFNLLSFNQKLFFSLAFMVFVLILTISFFVTRIYNENSLNAYTSYFRDNVNTMSQILTENANETDSLYLASAPRLRLFGYDFVIYNSKGKRVYSTNDGIFNTRLRTEYLNSKVIEELTNQDNTSIVKENFGKSGYYSGYSYFEGRNGENYILNTLNLDFEDTTSKSVNQFLNQVSKLIYLLLLVSLLLSYYLSNNIRKVLQNLVSQIKQLDFKSYNKRLNWQYQDEIGMLVKEYNNMLDKLEENIQKLTESERALAWKDLARQIAHEVKNPLTPMKLNIQHLEKMAKTDPEQLEKITPRITQSLINQIDQLAEISNDFSFFSNISQAEKTELSLNEILDKVESLYSFYSEVEFTLHRPLKDVNIMANQTQIHNLYTNIIKNGIEATEGKDKREVSVFHEMSNTEVLIYFSDNGHGIKEESKANIFTPNFTTKSSGTGLGLVIVKNIVEFHEGNIDFISVPNTGTTFIISLPLLA